MAGGVGIAAGGKEYPGKLTCHVLVTCIVAAMGGLIFGYDLGISGGVTSMAPFLKKFFPEIYRREELNVGSPNQYCKFDSETLTLFTSSLYLAALCSAGVSGWATKSFGRRATMLMGGLLFLAGAVVNACAINVAMLIIGRVLLGFGIGCANQSVPVYLSEMAPYKHRGTLNNLFQLSITIGILVANVLNYLFAQIKGGYGWRFSLGGAAVPALILTIGSICLPDTPNSMIQRGKYDEARAQLVKIRGITNVDVEFDDLVAACEASKKQTNQFCKLFHRKFRPQVLFGIAIPFFQQFTGNNVITFYAPVLFKTLGFGANASLMSAVITGAVNFFATFVSIFGADKWGRRALFIEGGTQMFICQVLIAGAIGYKFGIDGNPGTVGKNFAFPVVALICVYVAGFAWSWGPMGWLVPSEIFPLEIRSAANSLNCMTNMFFTFIVAQLFTTMLCHLKFGLFIFFGFFVLLMTVFIYYLLPETKGIPIEEMDEVWKNHWFWNRYVKDDKETRDVEISGGLSKTV